MLKKVKVEVAINTNIEINYIPAVIVTATRKENIVPHANLPLIVTKVRTPIHRQNRRIKFLKIPQKPGM